jgi:hypothetical protein
MGYYKILPNEIGKGEGGSKIAQIQDLLNAAAADMETLYTAASVNKAARTFRGNNETKYVLAGDIVDEDAAALAGALVTAYVKDTSNVAGAVLSDSDGYFTMNLYPGVYDVVISKTGYTSVSYDDTTVSADVTTFDKTLATNLAVLSTSPSGSSAQPASSIDIVFDRTLTDNSGEDDMHTNITLEQGTGVITIASSALATTTVSNDTLRLTLSGTLDEADEVTVTIPKAATVKGSNDELLADDYEFTFTNGYTYLVPDTLTPLDTATDIGRLNSITVLYTANISDNSGDDDIADGISVEVAGVPVEIASATVDTATLTITLTDYIECQGQLVEVTVNKAATVKTATGGIMENDLEFSFTMEDYLAVSSTVPVAGVGTSALTQIDIVFPVTLAFQNDAAAAAAAITVTDGGSPVTLVGGDITLEDSGGTDNVLRITTSIAEDNQTVTVIIPVVNTVKGNTKGELLEEDYVYSFTMANTP